MNNDVFVKSHETFRNFLLNDKETIKKALMTMQTVIRKLRQQLNMYARDKGFMLTDLFVMDPSRIKLHQVQHGKSGDLTKLAKFATKKRTADILSMIQTRYASRPDRVTKFPSIAELARSWSEVTNQSHGSGDELYQLQRSILVTRLGATIAYLRGIYSTNQRDGNTEDSDLVIASLDRSTSPYGNLNHIAATLVACAMGSWPLSLDHAEEDTAMYVAKTTTKLLLGQSEQVLGCYADAIDLLDGLVTNSLKIELDAETFVEKGEENDAGVASTKAVLNVIDRHVFGGENGTAKNFLLFTSADVRIPQEIQKKFSEQACKMHCHNSDDIGARLSREKARTGDITISLAWDTYDDLDLHVILPSGGELSFSSPILMGGLACLDVDMNAGGRDSKEPVENVYLGDAEKQIEAAHGKYKVFVRNFDYHTMDRTAAIPWRVVIQKNGQTERYFGKCQGSGPKSDQVASEFEYSGRTVPFPDEEKELFDASNLVSLTTSTGQTLESLTQLLGTFIELEKLDAVRNLVQEEEDGDECMDDNEERPLEADAGVLEVTSRDRLDILLAKLPKRFHLAAADAFGGISLVEECSEHISRQMVANKIPLSVLSSVGYPPEIVDAVKSKLASALASP
jgi:hypothetical protein